MDKPLASLAPQRTQIHSSECKQAPGSGSTWERTQLVAGWQWLRQLTCMAAPDASPPPPGGGGFEITIHWIF